MWLYRFRIISLCVFSLFIGLFCLGVLYQFISTELDEIRYPAPGKLVDIGGYKMHINCSGSGGPSVILDAGGGHFSLSWAFVQPEIAEFTHVCSYDRAGTGWSESSPLSRTAQSIVKELHDLLQTAHVPKPYILVGHSIGGIYMRLYANTYPEEVYGVVLVDSSHELQQKKMQEFGLRCPQQNEPFMQKLLGWFAGSYIADISGLTRLYLKLLYKDFIAGSPESVRAKFESRLILPSSWHAMMQGNFDEDYRQLKNSKNLLDNKPLIVISAGKTPTPQKVGLSQDTEHQELSKIYTEFHYKVWLPLQKDLATKSTRGKQLIAEKSDHMINFYQPEIIVSAIKEMVDEYRR